jgi:SAM-dependent methyltransferase
MLTSRLLEQLCCSTCIAPLHAWLDGELAHADGTPLCSACLGTYPVQRGVPDMVPREQMSGSDWKHWQAQLAAFQARRENRVEQPDALASRLAVKKSGVQPAFASFTGITSRRLLDVGCGPGKFRLRFPEGVEYYGIDPIPLAESADFPFARALAEHISFAPGTFAHVTVLAALGHFKDVSAFIREALRVLQPGGRLHILQAIHEKSPVRRVSRWLKDALEDRAARSSRAREAPHHMTQFELGSLHAALEGSCRVVAERLFSDHWYSPRKLFLTLAPST